MAAPLLMATCGTRSARMAGLQWQRHRPPPQRPLRAALAEPSARAAAPSVALAVEVAAAVVVAMQAAAAAAVGVAAADAHAGAVAVVEARVAVVVRCKWCARQLQSRVLL